MSFIKRSLAILTASVSWIALAHASEPEFLDFDISNMYFGGGLSYNSLSGRGWDDDVGGQVFGAWNFFRFGDLTVAGEAGVFASGSFSNDRPGVRSESIDGLYVNAVAKYPLTDAVWVQGRAGTNFSDTGSGMIGGGIGLRVTPTVSVRFEAARYGDVTSLIRVDAVIKF